MKSGGSLALYIESDRQQRASMVLRDVAYVIEAHFEIQSGTDNLQKHSEMFKRRALRGQYFHHPYLGCREFPANFELVNGEAPKSKLTGTTDLGWMLNDLDFADEMKPIFFRASMTDGLIEVPRLDSRGAKS